MNHLGYSYNELELFLIQRLTAGSGEVGRSSDALLIEVLTGAERHGEWDYPSDLSDLSRCFATFARAPWDLKKAMLPRLLSYCEHITNKYHPQPIPERRVHRRTRILGWWRSVTRPTLWRFP